MRKILSIIGWAVAAVGLIIGGIILLAAIPEGATDVAKHYSTLLGPGIALLLSGIGAGVGCLASFFTARTRDK